MKLSIIIFSVALVFMLIGCSGSETYRGKWKALNSDRKKFEIVFKENSFTISDSTGTEISKYDYTQNSIRITNSIENYGIHIDDGRTYQISFPKPDDESVGLIKDGNGTTLYTIGRNDFVNYNDIFGLN